MSIKDILAETPFFKGFSDEHLSTIAACAWAQEFAAGEYLIKQHDSADRFYLILKGAVSLKVYHTIRGAVPIQTLVEGDILGWSWLHPPYIWHFDGRALETTLTLSFNSAKVREAMEADHELGYRLLDKMVDVMTSRLQATRLQLMDVYGEDKEAK